MLTLADFFCGAGGSSTGAIMVLPDLERARLVWVRLTQGRGSQMRAQTGWRHYIDRAGSSIGMPGYLRAYVDRIAPCAERLQHVSLESRPALDLITSYGRSSSACLYVDPPYVGSARGGGYRSRYRVDMPDEASHRALLDALLACRASVVLSGYPSQLYDTALAGWDRIEIPTTTAQGGSSQARTEVLWSNRQTERPPPPTCIRCGRPINRHHALCHDCLREGETSARRVAFIDLLPRSGGRGAQRKCGASVHPGARLLRERGDVRLRVGCGDQEAWPSISGAAGQGACGGTDLGRADRRWLGLPFVGCVERQGGPTTGSAALGP